MIAAGLWGNGEGKSMLEMRYYEKVRNASTEVGRDRLTNIR
jgi:hypothetical protein